MLYTLSQAREQLKRFVDNGSCNLETVDARINEAIERLTDMADFECMRATIRIATDRHTFTLPYNVEKLLHATIDGTPAKIFGTAYQFLSSGIGDLDFREGSGSGFRDMVDVGEFPTQFDVPFMYTALDGTCVDRSKQGMQLIAFSTAAQDVGKTIKVRGFAGSGTGDEVNAGMDPGEEIKIHKWHGGIEGHLSGYWNIHYTASEAHYREITEVLKPETKGYVTLYAVVGDNVDPSKTHFSFLAKYHPRQTIPQFRRYSITNCKDKGCSSVLALVKLRNVPLVDGDDILPVDSMQALKLMVMAISEENKGNLQGALNFESQAVAVMQKRERARLQADGVPVILNVDYRLSTGRHLNRGGLIL